MLRPDLCVYVLRDEVYVKRMKCKKTLMFSFLLDRQLCRIRNKDERHKKKKNSGAFPQRLFFINFYFLAHVSGLKDYSFIQLPVGGVQVWKWAGPNTEEKWYAPKRC